MILSSTRSANHARVEPAGHSAGDYAGASGRQFYRGVPCPPGTASCRRENLIEGLEEEVGVFVLEYQGRPDLEHVPGRAGCAEQYSPLAHRLGYFAGVPGRWPACLIDQFDAEQEAFAPDVPDQGVASGECQQAAAEVGGDLL